MTGVIAFPVHHSLSPEMHNAAFQAIGLDLVYVPFNVHPDNLEIAIGGIRALGFTGVNITIPHKEQVIGYLDWVSEDARRIKSVNTIHNSDGVLKGYSTDGPGFIRALETAGKTPRNAKTVVLGAGGSARATAYALAMNGADVTVANRTLSRAGELADLLNSALGSKEIRAVGLDGEEAREAVKEADLLVNCTSVGMHPHPDAQPIPTEWLHSKLFVFDQIYNPWETNLLKAAKAVGAETANGIKMLIFQGAISFEIWTGVEAPINAMEEAVLAAAKRRELLR